MNHKVILRYLLFFLLLLPCIPKKVLAADIFNRIQGPDRYETAIQVSKSGWQNGSGYAVIATGEDFPDAICAAPLAKKYNAPLLLTNKNSLNQDVKQELTRLGVKQAYIIGGYGAISQDVENKLVSMNIHITRLSGQDRYETAVKIAQQLSFNGNIVIATGGDYPDALSISSIAAKEGMPILLSNASSLPSSVQQFLNDKSIKNTYIVGQNDVISDSIASSLPNVKRLAGNDRYDTNLAVINNFSNDLNFHTIFLSTGENYPDALAASVLAANDNAPLFLVSNSSVEKIRDFINPKLTVNTIVNAVGGSDVVPDALVTILSEESGNTNGNLQNGGIYSKGFVAEQGDWVYYYLEGGFLAKQPGGLYKIKKDGSNNTLIDRDVNDIDSSTGSSEWETRSYLNVIGDWIYYIDMETEMKGEDFHPTADGIYKIKIDGTHKTKICNDAASNLIVNGEWMYYINNSDSSKIYKMKIDGTQKTKINDDRSNNLNIDGDWIYYTSMINNGLDNQLCKIKTDGSLRTELRASTSNMFIVDNNYIYYSNNSSSNVNSLYRMNSDGTNIIRIKDFSSNVYPMFNVNMGNVYYLYPTDLMKSQLFVKPADGQGNEKLIGNVDTYSNIWLSNRDVYFNNQYEKSFGIYKIKCDNGSTQLINSLQLN